MRVIYPTIKQVAALSCNVVQLGRWMRFLPSPKTAEERGVLDMISHLFASFGGWTPEVSKLVGFEDPSRGRWADGP